MTVFKIATYNAKVDTGSDIIAQEIRQLCDAPTLVKNYLASTLAVAGSSLEELESYIVLIRKSVTSGQVPKTAELLRIIRVVSLALNAFRLLAESTSQFTPLHCCEHTLNLFLSHLKLIGAFDPLDASEVSKVISCFEYDELQKLSLPELSWLGHISTASVANAASAPDGHSRKLKTMKQGNRTLVKRSIALNWLRGCPAFQEIKFTQGDSAPDCNKQESVLVPIARDGSFISYQCRRSKGYQIGAKGHETYLPTLKEALEALSECRKQGETARWRRPNGKGIFGIVSSVRWEEKSREEVFGS